MGKIKEQKVIMDSYDVFFKEILGDENNEIRYGDIINNCLENESLLIMAKKDKPNKIVYGKDDEAVDITDWETTARSLLDYGSGRFVVRATDQAGANKVENIYKTLGSDIKIIKDSDGNKAPVHVIEQWTQKEKCKTNDDYKRNRGNLINYQVSHVWGGTKNPILFTAHWNICFLAKVLDPFSGHETMGKASYEFEKKFKEKVYSAFTDDIKRYNSFLYKNKEKIKNMTNYVEENSGKGKLFSPQFKNDFIDSWKYIGKEGQLTDIESDVDFEEI